MLKKVSNYIKNNLEIVFIILLVLCNIYGIEKRYIPWFTDEFGYWAAAALFRGHNWANVMSYSGYYGFGYGIILAFLVEIPNIRIRYYCAEVLNIIFIVLIYLMLGKIFRAILKEKKSILSICAVSMLYPYFIVYAHITQAEIFLTFWYVSTIYFLLRFYENKKVKYIVLLVLCSFMMFSVHLRSLVAILSLSCALIYILLSKRKDYKKILITIIFLLMAVLTVWGIKNEIVNILYQPIVVKSDTTVTNESLGVYLWILSQLKKLDTLKLVIKSVEGKVFYIGAATFLLVFSATHYLLMKIFSNECKFIPIYIYILMSFWGEVALTSISMYNVNRFDHLMYGRYSEAFIVPLVVYGIYILINHKHRKMYYFSYLFILGLMACDLYNYVKDKLFNGCMNMQISGIAGFNIFSSVDIKVLYTLIIVLLVAIVVVVLLKLKQRKAILLMIALIWFCVGQNTLKQNLYNGYWTAEQIETMAVEMANVDGKIYYLLTTAEEKKQDSVWRNMLYLQYMLVDKNIYPVDEKDVDVIEKDSILIVCKNTQDYRDYLEYDQIVENELFILMEN